VQLRYKLKGREQAQWKLFMNNCEMATPSCTRNETIQLGEYPHQIHNSHILITLRIGPREIMDPILKRRKRQNGEEMMI